MNSYVHAFMSDAWIDKRLVTWMVRIGISGIFISSATIKPGAIDESDPGRYLCIHPQQSPDGGGGGHAVHQPSSPLIESLSRTKFSSTKSIRD
jgi:hypothetical protein